jgi:Uncharacterised nucleotidyltransferase
MNPLAIRRQAFHWLLAATAQWVFPDRNRKQQPPHGDDEAWKTIGDLAYVHNVEPLLHWMVSNTEHSVKIPERLKQRWEQAYFGNFLRNEAYFEILKALFTECEKERVSILVLKGPALIGRIYKDPALRTLSDLDILCSPMDLHRIISIAHHMGYTIMGDGDDPAVAHHVAMFHAASEAILEFHFMPYEVIQNHARFMQLAWDRREWIDVGDFHCPVLCLQMELLFNIAHLVQHQFDVSLKHYLDIAGILVFCQKQLNRDGLGTLFRDFGLEQAFALTTGFLSTMMHLPYLSGAPRLTHENSAQREFNASLRDLLALLDEERLLDVRGFIWGFRIAFGNRVGFGNKIAYVTKTLFPFSHSLTDHGYRSSGDEFRYFLHQLRFYARRLFFTLAHLPKRGISNKKCSLAVKRAGAKDKITRQLQRVPRSR